MSSQPFQKISNISKKTLHNKTRLFLNDESKNKQSKSLNEIPLEVTPTTTISKTTTIKKSSTMLSPTNLDTEISKMRLRKQSWICQMSRRVSKWVSGPSVEVNDNTFQMNAHKMTSRSSASFSMSSR